MEQKENKWKKQGVKSTFLGRTNTMFTALSQKLVDSGWMGKISIPYSLKMNRIKNMDYVYFSYFSTALLKHHDQETYKRQHVIWLTVSDA